MACDVQGAGDIRPDARHVGLVARVALRLQERLDSYGEHIFLFALVRGEIARSFVIAGCGLCRLENYLGRGGFNWILTIELPRTR